MNIQTKRFAWIAIVLTTVLISFVVGQWSGSLQRSLKSEADYPWELHRKIRSADIQCDKILRTPTFGRFYVQTVDDGATLVIATYDRRTGMITTSVIDTSGRFATDTWYLDCK